MKFLLTQSFFLVLLSLLLVFACQPAEKKEAKTEETATEPQALAAILNGKLDTLMVTDTAFTKLPKKSSIFFSYFFNQNDTSLTLHGWRTKKNTKGYEYDANPDIVLANKTESSTSFGPNFYLSPIYLTDKVFDAIKDSIGNGYKFVVFAPTPDGSTPFGNLIRYKILLSKSNPFIMMMADSASGPASMVLVDPNLSANPSPPKENY